MKAFKNSVILLLVLSVILSFGSYRSVLADDVPDNAVLLPDGSGGVYRLTTGNGRFTLGYFSDGGDFKEICRSSINADGLMLCGGSAVVTLHIDEFFGMYRPDRKELGVVMIDNVNVKTGCHAMSDDETVFIVDEKDDTSILKFTNRKFPSGSIDAGSEVRALFSDTGTGDVYALTEKGISDVKNGTAVNCDVPETPFIMNRNMCCDSAGSVYSFDGAKGFRLLFRIPGARLAATDKAVYALQDGRLEMYSLAGEKTGVYPSEADGSCSIAASGDRVMLIDGSKAEIIKDGLFIAEKADTDDTSLPSAVSQPESVPEEKSSPSEDRSKPSGNSSDSGDSQVTSENAADTSTAEPERPESQNGPSGQESSSDGKQKSGRLTSHVYRIENGIICRIPIGTTLAVLKSNMSFDGLSAEFFDYKGRPQKTGKAGTGAKLITSDNSGNKTEYLLAVAGDVTGEGSVNTNDIRRLSEILSGTCGTNTCTELAADVDRSGSVDIGDLCALQHSYYSNNGNIPAGAFL